MDTKRECMTCKFFTKAAESLDDCPTICWECVGQARNGGEHYQLWEKKQLSDGMTEMSLGERPKAAINKTHEHPKNCSCKECYMDSYAGSSFRNQVGGDHYIKMKIQPIEFAVANGLDFFQKDIIKYVTRKKGDMSKRIEDLKKGRDYLDKYIEVLEAGEWA